MLNLTAPNKSRTDLHTRHAVLSRTNCSSARVPNCGIILYTCAVAAAGPSFVYRVNRRRRKNRQWAPESK